MANHLSQISPPRVLLISARSDIGGGPAHMFALAQGLVSDVTLFVALPEDGIFFEKFVQLLGSDHVCTIPRQKFCLRALWSLRSYCVKNQIDLIHSHGKGAGTYSRLLGVLLGRPVIHTLHGYHDGRYSRIFKRVYALWESLAACVTKKIICVSESESIHFKNTVCVALRKLMVIPNGTPVQKNHLAIPIPKKVVTVARFDYQKNLPEILEIARAMPNHHFFVIGDGEERPGIEAEISAKVIRNITLCGESQRVLEDIADAALYLTAARWEGLPLAVLEAMSLGIPVVASNVVGNRDAVAVGITGYLYPLGNINEAVCQIGNALKLDRDKIRAHHRCYFSSGRMVEQTLQLYRKVLG